MYCRAQDGLVGLHLTCAACSRLVKEEIAKYKESRLIGGYCRLFVSQVVAAEALYARGGCI